LAPNIESEASDESDESESSDGRNSAQAKKFEQEVTIQKIKTSPESPNEDCSVAHIEATIDAIMEKETAKNRYVHKDHQPTNMEVQLFRKKVYVHSVSKNINLLEQLGVSGITTTTVNCLIFYYNATDLFAISTAHGWQAVRSPNNVVDFEFPSAVASRLLTKEGMRDSIQRPLLGPDRRLGRTGKAYSRPDKYEPAYYTSYESKLRKNSSVLRTACLSTDEGGVKIGCGSVRFSQKINLSYLPNLLDHLAKICRKEKTFEYNLKTGEDTTNEEEDCPEAHRQLLQRITRWKLRNELDQELTMEILNFANDLTKLTFNFDFCYHKVDDFMNATKFVLLKGRKSVKSWNQSEPPSFRQVVIAIAEFQNFQNSVAKKKWISNLSFSFTNQAGKRTSKKLLQFVDGEVIYLGLIYSHIDNAWLKADDDYLARTHSGYIELLRECGLKKDSDGYISKIYKPGKEPEFNESFRNQAGFLVGDKVYYQKIELFDLLFYNVHTKATFIYHVKESFGQKTRDACSQILNSAYNIRRILESGGDLADYYNKIKATNQTIAATIEICESLDKFKEALKSAYIVYAVADTTEKKVQIMQYFKTGVEKRSFEAESQKKTKLVKLDLVTGLKNLPKGRFSLQTFSECLNCNNSYDEITDKLISLLIRDKFISHSDLALKAKLLYATKDSFKDFCFSAESKCSLFVYELLQPYMSNYQTLIGKLELLRVRDILPRYGYQGKFKIMEIPTNKS